MVATKQFENYSRLWKIWHHFFSNYSIKVKCAIVQP